MTAEMQRELARCEREIADHTANLRAGHPDVVGLTMALSDWAEERRLILEAVPVLTTAPKAQKDQHGASQPPKGGRRGGKGRKRKDATHQRQAEIEDAQHQARQQDLHDIGKYHLAPLKAVET